MSRLTLFKFVFLIFFIFISKSLFAQKNEVEDVSPSSLESEVNLPIFEDDKADLNNKDIQNISLFNVADLVTIFLFFLAFLFCIFLFKKIILNHKKIRDDNQSDLIRELAFYEIDNKNSVRIIIILGNVYVFLVSGNSSILLREIKRGEELDNLEFGINKAKSRSNVSSFKAIFDKILRKDQKNESSLDETEYAELENDIETSLKSKQDRLKKF
ncbi:Flagellar biosynthetic protein fliZ [Borrelia nietonii YOR]|uniref:Flagellar biosynthetic protein fliZ n=1 Tax=Borrelia nietonii YOR TaxID=1293576 RepID=A0ABN4C333_9SPIR|nr:MULTISPECIES: flagella biosynthesis regulatory protein FliZ [Borrelia]AHH03251.1 Flagellar biosynthetic protein fliZ [Borrelia nietonii YOR]AHH13776.1 Flagellar biosynthetic protein fliZ [Borrelia hermsii MTW]UPA08998.1 flagella biosynthesis regulatory protein FliZ [Borrelia nietonii YOR]